MTGNRLDIDLAAGVVRTATGAEFPFTLAARYRDVIVEGIDMLDGGLRMRNEVECFEQRHRAGFPWLRVSASMPRA